MSFLDAVLTIARLTVHEAARRRVLVAALLCGIAFLLLYGLGFHFVARETGRLPADAVQRRLVIALFTLTGLYAANFLTVLMAVLLPVDTLSGEISSGVMQTVASKPVRRSAVVLGKWLAYSLVTIGYLLLLAGGVVAIAFLRTGIAPPELHRALPLMALEAVLLVTVSIAGGTRFATVTNGILAFGLYGIAFLGGWVEQIGTFAGNDTARRLGVIASLLMPCDALWRLASLLLQPPIARGIPFGPFVVGSVPTAAMVWWAAGYVVVTLVLGLRWFAKRPL